MAFNLGQTAFCIQSSSASQNPQQNFPLTHGVSTKGRRRLAASAYASANSAASELSFPLAVLQS